MKLDEKLVYLICYAIVVCFITVRSFIKRNNPIYSSIWALYAVSAVFCVLCKIDQTTLVGHSVLHDRWYDLSDTTWWSYVVLVTCNLIAFNPIKDFNRKNQLAELGTDKRMLNFFEVYAFLYLVFALLFILPCINNIIGTLGIKDFGLLRTSLYGNSENEGGVDLTSNVISSVAFKLCVQFKYLSVFVSFCMIKEKKKIPLAIFLILTTFFVYFVNCMANAARGGLLIFVFCSCMIGIVFYPYLSKVNKRRIFITAMVVLAVVFSLFMAITISRFANDGGGGNPILRNIAFYLGHGPIEFSKITGSLDDFAYGKTIIGRLLSHYFGISYSWDTISTQIGYPAIGAVFVTYLGFMYTDFGAFGCYIFVATWAFFVKEILRRRPKKISTIFFFMYYLHYYVTGNFTIGRLEYASVITTFVIYFMIRVVEKSPELRRLFTAKLVIGKGRNSVRNIE